MTPDEISRLKAIADAATPGPWTYYFASEVDVDEFGPKPPEPPEQLIIQSGSVNVVYGCGCCGSPQCSKADAAFIAAAREAVPALIAEVERLQKVRSDKVLIFGKFNLGQAVKKPRGYPFPGTYRGSIWTEEGEERVIIQHKDGWLHIFNPEQIEPV